MSRTKRATVLVAFVALAIGVGHVAFALRSSTIDSSTSASSNSAAPQSSGDVRFSWTRSLPIDYQDPSIGIIGGTELRAIVGLEGKLYAANTYWNDSDMGNRRLPGAQIYRLDGPSSQWQVEYELPKTMTRRRIREYQGFANLVKVTFTQDKYGNKLVPNAKLLIAGVFSRGSRINVFLRSPSGHWSANPIPPQSYLPKGGQIRPFVVHTDAVTGAQMIFAGGSDVIFSGEYDAQTRTIDWNASPDWLGLNPGKNNIKSNGGRITSFAVCDGKLYAAGRAIYVREDGASPSWKKIFSLPSKANGRNLRGFSGLTCARGLTGGPALFSGFQGNSAVVVRVDLGPSGPKPTVELDVARLLSGFLGTTVKSAIIAYNDVTIYPAAEHACPSLLFGFTIYTPLETLTFASTHKYTKAGFLVRDCKANFAVQWVEDPSIKPTPHLVAVRAIALSPFSQDPPGTIYVGGFDAGNAPAPGVHNTAWLYRGVPLRDSSSLTVNGRALARFREDAGRDRSLTNPQDRGMAY
jgi:hypothetical protein